MQNLHPDTLGAARNREARQLGLKGYTARAQSSIVNPASFVSNNVDQLSSFDLHERASQAHPCSRERMDMELEAMMKESLEQLECTEEDAVAGDGDASDSEPESDAFPADGGWQWTQPSQSVVPKHPQVPWWELD